MGISKRNSEGYADPTAFRAVCSVEREVRKHRQMVYICSPYSDDPAGNSEKARRYCRYAVVRGKPPIALHLWILRKGASLP